MSGQEIPIGLDLEDRSLTFVDLHMIFSEHPYGMLLGNKTRWDIYKPEGMTNEEWTTLLGADSDNLEHMHLMYGITRQFLMHSECSEGISDEATFDQNEKQLLLLTAIVHDWPEAITGDIMFYQKTEADETKELAAFQAMVNEVLPEDYQTEVAPLIQDVIENILKDRSTKLGKAFNAIERIGYLRTGLIAYEKQREAFPDLQNNLTWLTSNVLSYQIPTMIQYASIYPAVREYLLENRDRITKCFMEIDDTIFENYSPEDRDAKMKLYYRAKNNWQQSDFSALAEALS